MLFFKICILNDVDYYIDFLYWFSRSMYFLFFSSVATAIILPIKRLLTTSHGVNYKETLQTVTMFSSFSQLFHNVFPVLTAIYPMAYSPEEMKSTLNHPQKSNFKFLILRVSKLWRYMSIWKSGHSFTLEDANSSKFTTLEYALTMLYWKGNKLPHWMIQL